MSDLKVNEGSYVNIQSFMVNDLKLSGNELIAYAVIYGFSQDGSSWFTGSAAYLAAWCGCSKRTIMTILSKLCERGLIAKRERFEHGIKLCDYHATSLRGGEEIAQGMQKLHGGSEEIADHILEDNLDVDVYIGNQPKMCNEAAHFQKPTVKEVEDYANLIGFKIDGEQFIAYYEARGWMLGNTPAASWKALVTSWKINHQKAPKRSYSRKEATADAETIAIIESALG